MPAGRDSNKRGASLSAAARGARDPSKGVSAAWAGASIVYLVIITGRGPARPRGSASIPCSVKRHPGNPAILGIFCKIGALAPRPCERFADHLEKCLEPRQYSRHPTQNVDTGLIMPV